MKEFNTEADKINYLVWEMRSTYGYSSRTA